MHKECFEWSGHENLSNLIYPKNWIEWYFEDSFILFPGLNSFTYIGNYWSSPPLNTSQKFNAMFTYLFSSSMPNLTIIYIFLHKIMCYILCCPYLPVNFYPQPSKSVNGASPTSSGFHYCIVACIHLVSCRVKFIINNYLKLHMESAAMKMNPQIP